MNNISVPPIKVQGSIRWKLILPMMMLMLFFVISMTLFQISSQKKILAAELEKRIKLMQENLEEKGKYFSENLYRQVEEDIAAMNISGMVENIRKNVTQNDFVKYAVLTNGSRKIFVHTLHPDTEGKASDDTRHSAMLQQEGMLLKNRTEADESVTEIVCPIRISTEPWGILRVILNRNILEAEIRKSREQIAEENRSMIRKIFITSCIFMVASFVIVLLLSARFSKPLADMTRSARKMSEGDFTRRIHARGKDEIGILAKAMNDMAKNLNNIISKNMHLAEHFSDAASDQTASLDETVSLLTAMSDTIEKNTENAQQADRFMQKTAAVVSHANDAIERLTLSMEEISAAGSETFNILKNIDEIAFQTNLLSLNAAVEAARAGDSGAGFAVVANEVRNLALRSGTAAGETGRLIQDTAAKIKDGVQLVTLVNEGFREVAANAEKVAVLVSEISLASAEQNEGIDRINEAMRRMSEKIRENTERAEALNASMSVFRVSR
ncbi:MAG: methyl-accepting chemotaxis protein [Desulfococcaceae bacterium]|nr:methyl-accepting chemotaxis protein [Desulfococcaceae bacterium]